ncbi:DUF3015 domain-containing protein [bacterium]|nr:DUF3015 domain-containing protein [bacterium]
MKRTLVLAAIGVMLSGGVALADPDVGCGWGTMAFKGQTGVAAKVLAATTNSSLGNQTFGISSGTAGCKQGGTVTADARLQMYASANIDQLASDMASGRGESLDTLAQLIGVADADKPAFFAFAKRNFGALFPADQVTAGELLTALKGLMATDALLAQYVS